MVRTCWLPAPATANPPLSPRFDLVSRGCVTELHLLREVPLKSRLEIDPKPVPSSDAKYKFLGRFVGTALLRRHVIGLPLCKFLFRALLDAGDSRLSVEDLDDVDAELAASMRWVLANSVSGVLDETFTAVPEGGGPPVLLKEGGDSIALSDENKAEWVALRVSYRLKYAVAEQTASLVRGFSDVIAPALLERFTPHNLESLLCGSPSIDVDGQSRAPRRRGVAVDNSAPPRPPPAPPHRPQPANPYPPPPVIRAYTLYEGGLGERDRLVQWLWAYLRKCTQEQRRAWLMYVERTALGCAPTYYHCSCAATAATTLMSLTNSPGLSGT